MKPMLHKRFTILITNLLYWSKAYQSLTLSARNLMWCMVAELTFTGSRPKGTFEYTNNGKISFTETEFKKQKLGCSATYQKAKNQLIEVGFIETTYRGGHARGDMNTYKLLFIKGVSHFDMKWKNYPKKNWKKDIPKIEDYSIGRDTRFKKKKNTLKKKTLKSTTSPNKSDPLFKTPLKD